jgi:hypothetical protein
MTVSPPDFPENQTLKSVFPRAFLVSAGHIECKPTFRKHEEPGCDIDGWH